MTSLQERFRALGYAPEACRHIDALLGPNLAHPAQVATLVEQIAYDDSWQERYEICSVTRSLGQKKMTCINAAILAFGLLECFSSVSRSLYAMHRVDSHGVECGHAFVCYCWNGRYGSIAKSNYEGLNNRDAVFATEQELVLSYAKAYLRMGFTPTYYGRFDLDDIAGGLDWRNGSLNLNELSNRISSSYQYEFSVRRN